MTPPKRIDLDIGDGLAIEYVRGRHLLRMVGGPHAKASTTEVPIPEFINRLGINLADLVPARHYLLFAGPDGQPAGGAGDLVGVYPSETEGRAAFRELRLAADSRSGWAHLVAVSADCRPTPVCWFGQAPGERRSPRGPNAVPAKADAATPEPRPGTARRLRGLGRRPTRVQRPAADPDTVAGTDAGPPTPPPPRPTTTREQDHPSYGGRISRFPTSSSEPEEPRAVAMFSNTTVPGPRPAGPRPAPGGWRGQRGRR